MYISLSNEIVGCHETLRLLLSESHVMYAYYTYLYIYCKYIQVHIMQIYVCMYICMNIRIYIYIYIRLIYVYVCTLCVIHVRFDLTIQLTDRYNLIRSYSSFIFLQK